jgi:hypothetical protein
MIERIQTGSFFRRAAFGRCRISVIPASIKAARVEPDERPEIGIVIFYQIGHLLTGNILIGRQLCKDPALQEKDGQQDSIERFKPISHTWMLKV